MRSMLFLLCLCVAAVGGCLPASAFAASKPNFIILLSDDCGYDEFSFNGSKTIPTPRIDSIASAGVRFSNGYVSGAVCSPSRAGLLTGRYQEKFGHEFNIPAAYSETNGLSLEETTLPSVMVQAGYRTMAFGKWHLGYAPKFHPMERGFQGYYGFLQGQRSYFPLQKGTRLNQMLNGREPAKEQFAYMTDELGQQAAAYIAKNKDAPFFIYLAFNATHAPHHALESDLAKTGGNKIAAMTIALDRAIGVVLDELKKDGLTDNTIVVFINDNGGASGHNNAPLRGFKGGTWEGGIRVPFSIQWPGVIPAGKTYDHPVISLDLFATAIAVAGVDKSPGKPLDGVNLIPFITGKNAGRPHQTLYWKHGEAWAIRVGDLKLAVGDAKTKTPEMFDLAHDVAETTNLAPAQPAEVARLQKLYDAWKATNKPTPWRRGPDDGEER